MARFLVVIGPREPGERFSASAGPWRQRLPRAMKVRTVGRMSIAVSAEPCLEFAGGTIVGPVFDRRDSQAVTTIREDEARLIVGSRGQRLTDRYWGGYLAVLSAGDEEAVVVRAPFGELPCYYTILDGAAVCASDIGLLVETGFVRPTLAREAIVRELAWRDFRGSETCLAGIAALRGGDRLTITGGSGRVEPLWSPWAITSRAGDAPAGELAARVRRDVQACVAARASPFERVLLLLSGGLDSSIVAASLAASAIPFDLATMTTHDALGDERTYASAVADAVGHPLHQAQRDVGRIDPGHSAAARLPRPATRLFEQETARISRQVAKHTGARAIMTGGGGDNVFCSLQSAAPVADRWSAKGFGRDVLQSARDIALMAQASMPAVLWAALGRLPRFGRGSSAESDLSFVAKEARGVVGSCPHPWVAAPGDALPGQAAHIKLLAVADSFMQGFDPQDELATLTPLLSQPLVETCLSIPSWSWFAGGLNRVCARRAFSAELPDAIAWRRSKGTPDGFVAEIYERYQPVLRDRLLGGVLAREGLVDTSAIERAFSGASSLVPPDFRRLLRLSDVETWARAWQEQI